MALIVLLDPDVFVDGVEASPMGTTLNVNREVNVLDADTFGEPGVTPGWSEKRPGLRRSTIRLEGYGDWATGALGLDAVAFAALGSQQRVTVTPTAVADGDLAYTFSGYATNFTPLEGEVGELAGTSLEWVGSNPLVRGTVLSSPRTARTVAGTGVARNLGAVSATQRLWVGLHVIASAGGTITPRIESDDAVGFPSATTRVTGAGMTTPGSQWLSVTGPVTDSWWRAAWAVTGGSHLLLVTAGIQ